MSDDNTTGEATAYYAMPTAPDKANAASLLAHVEALRGAQGVCARLEAHGWVPRWCDNPGDGEFFEFAYEKRFASEDEAVAEIERLGVGVDPIWEED